jgi:hypothetical protein
LPILSSALECFAEQDLSHDNIQKKFAEYKKKRIQEIDRARKPPPLEGKLKDFVLRDNVLNKLRNPLQMSRAHTIASVGIEFRISRIYSYGDGVGWYVFFPGKGLNH